jgi:hypothetical protein
VGSAPWRRRVPGTPAAGAGRGAGTTSSRTRYWRRLRFRTRVVRCRRRGRLPVTTDGRSDEHVDLMRVMVVGDNLLLLLLLLLLLRLREHSAPVRPDRRMTAAPPRPVLRSYRREARGHDAGHDDHATRLFTPALPGRTARWRPAVGTDRECCRRSSRPSSVPVRSGFL